MVYANTVIILIIYWHLDYSTQTVHGFPGWQNPWQNQWGQSGNGQWWANGQGNNGQWWANGQGNNGQWGNAQSGNGQGGTGQWGNAQWGNGGTGQWGSGLWGNGQWNSEQQPGNNWANWGQAWNGNNNGNKNGQQSSTGGWPNWGQENQNWQWPTTPNMGQNANVKSNTNANPIFPGGDFSSFWNHGAPFSQLMFMSTMVGEDKDTICPQVQEGTPEYFADQTNLISNPEHLTELYSKHPPPTTTKNAKEFFKTLIPNGEHQFQPALDQDIGDRCMNIKPCDPSVIFRTLTGECNNARFPMWGVTDVNLVPLVPAHYEDNNDKIRVSKSGKPLINARKLHRKLISDQPKESTTISYAFMIWSQLISHDTARIMDQRPATGPTCLCCTNDGQMIPEDQRAAVCQPIEIPADDPFYSKHNVHCLNFVRSLTTNEMDCIIEPDQKLGDVSHYLDCSVVYGSTPKKCNSLREFNGGRLRAEIVNGREYMPPVEHPEKGCFKSPTCFDAGDDRCNQNNQLAVMHLMLFRLHNLSCKELLKLNPHWDDEKTFQVARIIVISLFQHITYEESLPILLGREFAVMQNLSGITTLRDDLYQQFLNPGTLVEYTSATDRLLHTLVPSKVKLYNKEGQVTEEHKLSDTFHNPHRLKDSKKLTQLLYGMVYQPSNEINTGVTPELTNLMFKCDQPYGFDLLAMDIDRAREHGVTTYKNLRVACGLSEIKTFADLIGIMSPENIEKLKSLYEVVDDVDAFIGMYMEFKIPGSLTGPVMQCIMTEQFKRWQLGDIYYYAFSNSNNPLSESQFQQIRNSSLSMLFCMCGDNIEQMPKNSFLLVGPGNEMVPCSQIPKISFDPWKESS